MKKYKFFDHTADVLFEAYGKTLNELFENSALALQETQTDLKDVKQKIKRKINLKNKSVEMLLFDFLQELIYLKDADYMLFSKFKIKIKKDKNNYILNSEVSGEKINPKKHELKVDVKAITLHKFYVKKIKDKWKAQIILDI